MIDAHLKNFRVVNATYGVIMQLSVRIAEVNPN
jgi:hypothetical protein